MVDTREQLGGVRVALEGQVMELDTSLEESVEQCSLLQNERVREKERERVCGTLSIGTPLN